MTADTPGLLAITLGDPCGIGPETIAKAVGLGATGQAVVVGDVAVLRRAVQQCGLLLPVARLDAPADALQAPPGCIAVWQPPGWPAGLVDLPMGQVHADVVVEGHGQLARATLHFDLGAQHRLAGGEAVDHHGELAARQPRHEFEVFRSGFHAGDRPRGLGGTAGPIKVFTVGAMGARRGPGR